MRRIRNILLALAFAALGAVAGRFVADSRRRAEAGEPFEASLDAVAMPGIRDLVPGLVAALRVHDRPWSYLHLPSWLAAFAVNFVVIAFGRDLPFLRALGITGDDEPRRDGHDDEHDAAAGQHAAPPQSEAWVRSEVWTADVPAAPGTPTASPPAPGFRPFAG